jgi:2-polyprenyl-6-methoxyphenol hydroxylase-like FAD-dependent oxidoreductase
VTDVLIAGGGVAGSSLTIMLGRKGMAVRVFEKARFAREKPCGEGLMPQGVAVLQRLGLTAAVGGCPFYGVRFHFQAETSEVGAPKVIRFRSPGLGQRRRALDQVLLSAAAATSGVQVHTGTKVDGPITEKGAVVGLRVDGQELRAPLVIGADGAHSAIRQQLGLNEPASADIVLPTTDGREIRLRRITEPTAEQKSMLHQLGLSLPERPKSLSKCSADSAIA